jgi:ribonuclease E
MATASALETADVGEISAAPPAVEVAETTSEDPPSDAAVHHEAVLVDPEGFAVIEQEDDEEEPVTAEANDTAAPDQYEIEKSPESSEDRSDLSSSTESQMWSGEAAAAEQRATPDSTEDESDDDEEEEEEEEEHVEQLGGDAMEEVPNRAPRVRRQYKIQEVIKRRQVLLVQVVKEERGNKGAALTTYLSLAGRYSVLMPNTARGGGISRKITDSADRKRLKAIASELDVPEGMGVILRTAGASRTKAEVKRDFEYLLRMWESVRELTLKSTAPTLVYEEGSLIKRSIRDLYNKDIDEIIVAGEDSYREAKDFMRMLMPSHAKNVKPYREVQPIFAKAGAEAQLDALFSNQVTLRSGGYLVINQAEALVAIDVNSGRSTREHNIEDTALRTNLEAADEIARQLRLRDLAGLIVVDFIDMEEHRNNRSVERRLKEALKNDRARIQVGRISHFGLLEMSRQRIRTGILEGSTILCPHCAGSGMVRSTASISLHVLRVLEEALIKSSAHNLIARTRTEVALYILNQKRPHLRELEKRFGVQLTIGADDTLQGTVYHALERGEPAAPLPDFEHKPLIRVDSFPPEDAESEAEIDDSLVEEAQAGEPERGSTDADAESETEEENSRRRRRRRRRRGRGMDRDGGPFVEPNAPQPSDAGLAAVAVIGGDIPARGVPLEVEFSDGETDEREAESFEVPTDAQPDFETAENSAARRRRRSRRGGRNRRREGPAEDFAAPEIASSHDWLPDVEHHDAIESEAATTAPAEGDDTQATTQPEMAAPVDVSAPPSEMQPSESSSKPAPEPSGAMAAPDAAGMADALPSAPAGPKRTGWWQRAKASFGSH